MDATSNEKIPRSDTAATAAFDVENPPQPNPYLVAGGAEPTAIGVGFPGLPGMPRGARVASDQVYEAYRAGQTLQCVTVMDCLISVLSVLTWFGLWGIVFLFMVPFGVVGRFAASRYSAGRLLQTYIGYLFFALAVHVFIAVLLFVYVYPFDGVFELLKVAIYGWFTCVALKFRTAVTAITRDDRGKLRSGRFTIARFEHLVFI